MNQSQQVIKALGEVEGKRSLPLKPGTVVFKDSKFIVRATQSDGEIVVKGRKMDGDPMVVELGTGFIDVVREIDAAKTDKDKSKVVAQEVESHLKILRKEGVKIT